jgi:hypothetical protein
LEAAADGLSLRFGDARLRIVGETPLQLQAGQQARAEVVRTDQGIGVSLLPAQGRSGPPPTVLAEAAGDGISPILLSVLEGLGMMEAAPQVAPLLPSILPETQAAVRLVAPLFLTRASTGQDLEDLARLMEQAAAQGVLSGKEVASFTGLVRRWLPSEWALAGSVPVDLSLLEDVLGRYLAGEAAAARPGSVAANPADARTLAGFLARFLEAEPQFLRRPTAYPDEVLAAAVQAFLATLGEVEREQATALQGRDAGALSAIIRHVLEELEAAPMRILQSAAERAGQPVEARLAAAMASGRLEAAVAELAQDMRTQLGRLQRNGSFVEFLRRTGQQARFGEAAQRVMDRASGEQLQNLHAADVPYQFLEIPFSPHAPIQNVQIHILGEGRGRKSGGDGRSGAVAIDLATTGLGNLWIALTMDQGVCRCRVLARTPEAVRTIDAHAAELAARLNAVGYAVADIRASLWDGDRLSEAVKLVACFKGMDFQA